MTNARWALAIRWGAKAGWASILATRVAAGEPAPVAPAGSGAPVPAGSGAPVVPAGSGAPAEPSAQRAGSADSLDIRAHAAALFPTTVVRDPSEAIDLRADSMEREPLAPRARQLDQVLIDGLGDLQFSLDVSDRARLVARERTEMELVDAAARREEWVIYPTIGPSNNRLLVRIVAVAPSSKVLLVRSERLKPSELAVRAVVMLRDVLTRSGRGGGEAVGSHERESGGPKLIAPTRSPGRAPLALNAALFGAYVGYSIQRASDSEDPRLLYPLMALGTGFGVGVSALIAEEWDVSVGDAWYLSAGAWWPAAAGYFIVRGRSDASTPEQYGASIVGAAAGVGLATTALALRGSMSEGGALTVHSVGAFGTFLGAMTDFAIRGTTDGVPSRGLGYGAAAGVIVGGALATCISAEPAQVLAVDLGAGLGALAGAAGASPFIFNSTRPADQRAFLVSTMAGTLAGGVLAYFIAPTGAPVRAQAFTPFAGPVATETAPGGRPRPVMGLGVRGIY